MANLYIGICTRKCYREKNVKGKCTSVTDPSRLFKETLLDIHALSIKLALFLFVFNISGRIKLSRIRTI